VSVHDAETSRPIPQARVDLRFLYVAVVNAPHPVSATTGEDGMASLRAATFNAQEWSASADGFLNERRMLIGSEKDARSIQFKLYRAPPPSVIVVVPDGYHGPLMVDRRPIDRWLQGAPGQRTFTFQVSPDGYVGIDATPLLTRMDPFAVTAVFENGSPIPEPGTAMSASSIALRSVDVSGTRTLFAVGTEADAEKIRPLVYNYKDGDPHNVSLNHERFNAMFDAARAKTVANKPAR
jgi:hypothetical protein